MITLTNIQDLCLIYESENSAVYRGIRISDHQPVIIKKLKENYPHPEKLARYQQEYKITHSLNLEGVIKAYNFEQYDHNIFIVFEDFGGESLKLLLTRKKEQQLYFSLEEFLILAIKISRILGEIHQHQIIHKDLNPSNIVFNEQTKQLKLIDFGISTQFSRENISFNHFNLLEGTLAYISPEQTGRINRSIDYRTDFYSLGCTFYELLTRQLPFSSNDLIELIYFHLTKLPLSFQEINLKLSYIPPIIEQIVFKLMAKKSEERYQSAWGITRDLEYCLQQLQDTGKIQNFVLGEEDYYPQLIIPEEVYGRETEIKTLINGFQSFIFNQKKNQLLINNSLMILGESGLGKSVLMKEIYPHLTKVKGYLILINFTEDQKTIFYDALVIAMRNFFKQLMGESQIFIEKLKEKIKANFSEKLNLLLELIPELKLVFDQKNTDNIRILSPQFLVYQSNFLLQKLLLIINQIDLPVVLVFDNLQFADQGSLNILKYLLELSDSNFFLIITSNNNFCQSLNQDIQQKIKTINLYPLDLNSIELMIIDTFKCSSLKAYELAKIILDKTGGNPLFIKEFLLLLEQKKIIYFDLTSHLWQWDFSQIEAQEITTNIADLITNKIQELPLIYQYLLKIAVCLGYTFNLKPLAKLLNKTVEEIDLLLKYLVKISIILPVFYPLQVTEEKNYYSYLETESYQFSHQKIYQAIDANLKETEKQEIHLKIARNMLSSLHSFEFEKSILEIVNHYNQGIKINRDNQKEIIAVIHFNLLAAKKAKLSKNFPSVLEYLYFCLNLINSLVDPWQNYAPLMINFYQEIALAELVNGNFAQGENFCNLALSKITNLLDRVNFYEILIKIKHSQNQPKDALKIGLNLLNQLGINLNQKSTDDLHLFQKDRKIKDISKEDQLSLNILVNLLRSAIMIKPQLIPSLVNHIINLASSPQNTYFLIIAYSYYGTFLCRKGENITSGYRLGKISVKLLKKLKIKENQGKIYDNFYGIIAPWQMPIQDTLIPLRDNIKNALDSGDLDGIGISISLACQNLFLSGKSLIKINQEYQEYLELMTQLNLTYYRAEIKIWDNLLIKFTEKDYQLINFNYDNYQDQSSFLFFNYLTDSIYYYYFKDYAQAKLKADLARKYQKNINNLFCYSQFICYYVLILLANAQQATTLDKKTIIRKVNYYLIMVKKWAKSSAINFQYLVDLINAEKLKILGKTWQSLTHYEKAIQGAKASKNLQHIALSYELTAQFYLAQGLDKIAQLYLEESYYYYLTWGGINKAKLLAKEYPNLLNLNQLSREQTFSHLSTITSNSDSLEFDLQSIVKAYQALSQEIHLDQLLNQIMKIVLENAGADQGILLFYHEQKWLLASVIGKIKQINKTREFADFDDIDPSILPKSILSYVARTQENIILNQIANHHQFIQDSYFISQQPKAILCLPLLYQQQLIGILYLENHLTSEIFTTQRIELLNLLSAQAIICLQNAQLYSTLEQKVTERTAELSQTLENLQKTQQQLIEAEKMASLGGLVAGVAHEINTPIGIGVMMASHLTEETKKFMTICESGSLKRTILNDYLDTAIESSQLILNNLQKAAQLIQSFKKVAVDQTHLEKRSFLVKEYLAEILISLQPSLKSPNYFVTIEGDEKIKIESYPGAFSQIFTNLILNSIKHAYPTGKIGNLKIKIKKKNNWLEIRYSDDGCGISPDNLTKIFEPFFTTSRNQGGTGLGLHIVYNLVRQTLKGNIDCQSELEKGTTFILTLPLDG